jgi:hypothetical protein
MGGVGTDETKGEACAELLSRANGKKHEQNL